ncbi:MAG: DUF1422 family protein [Psychromonas sp.]|nr:DUF1422 family protein [Psychromonas sp.]
MNLKNISFYWLIYPFIMGISLSASYYILTKLNFHFSIFPFLALYFSVSKFYYIYTKNGQAEDWIKPAWASFFLGIFSYSALQGMLHPELGSNLLSIIVMLVLLIWFFYKLIFGNKSSQA